jgi:hypothetical protein
MIKPIGFWQRDSLLNKRPCDGCRQVGFLIAISTSPKGPIDKVLCCNCTAVSEYNNIRAIERAEIGFR